MVRGGGREACEVHAQGGVGEVEGRPGKTRGGHIGDGRMKVDGRFGFEKPTSDVQRRSVNLSLWSRGSEEQRRGW